MIRATCASGGLVVMVLMLACGGVLSAPSERATQMCTFLSTDHDDVLCQAAGVGDDVQLDGFRLRVDGVEFPTAPSVFDDDEIGEIVIVRFTIENTTPLRLTDEFNRQILTTTGDAHYSSESDARRWGDAHDVIVQPDIDDLVPGQPQQFVHAYSLPEDQRADAVFHVWTTDNRVDTEDPRGRRRDFTNAMAVIDLGIEPSP